ncbi:uncharacterized protein BXZ73DRAFT_87620 [Epithele typhae]|uniref:uncharacterized protein n=1 Tax=Epithele typhae TaxID=378194 RepID=UPI002007572E|nr:uncharacterized protein BXZ73DRAFT_87620 [Epithele typhae]KAH9943245.1 hypothetical protein BXZ73DRAFT_87620 [Epithele typhae]
MAPTGYPTLLGAPDFPNKTERPRPSASTPPAFPHNFSDHDAVMFVDKYQRWLVDETRQPVVQASSLDRRSVALEYEAQRNKLQQPSGSVRWFMSIVGGSKHSSTVPLENLMPGEFSPIPTFTQGRYLLCRVVAPALVMNGVHLAVEDVEGTVQKLSIYNFPSTYDCTFSHLDALFPIGGIMIIREPTLKTATQGAFPVVRVDSPTDVGLFGRRECLSRGPKHSCTTDAWIQRGNEYANMSQWFLAAHAYCHALTLDPTALAARLNRAEAYLHLGYFSGAQCDAQRVLDVKGLDRARATKARFRLARAQYGRKQFANAEKSFYRFAEETPTEPSASQWITQCQARRREASTGLYDWATLYRTAYSRIRLDVAEYWGPMKVSRMPHMGGGRGVVTARDVQVGELLLVSKPFASVYHEDLPKNRVVLTFDLLSGGALGDQSGALLLSRIVERLYGNPDVHAEVYELYAGSGFPSPPDNYSPSCLPPQPVDLLSPICNIDQPREPTSGAYPSASLFNHACSSTAVWYCIGDVLAVRAASNLPSGTEVTIPYTVEPSYRTRQAALRAHMMRELEARIGATFASARGPVRPLHALALHALAERLRLEGSPRCAAEAIGADVRALRCFGLTVRSGGGPGLPIATDGLPVGTTFERPAEVLLRIAGTLVGLGERTNAEPWVRAALWVTNASVGGGTALFMDLHRKALDEMGLGAFAANVLAS